MGHRSYANQWYANTNQWVSGNSAAASQASVYGLEHDPSRDAVRVKTAVDWLRGRVAEVTSLAFSEVPA